MFASVITTETFGRQCQYATAEFVFLYIIVMIFPGQQRTHFRQNGRGEPFAISQ